MMKGGVDEEMSPLFPRLHVKDTEKGGPRAPPRNKMALYEQLCVPSIKSNFESAPSLSLSPINSGVSVPLVSSSKEGGLGQSAFPPVHIPLSSSHSDAVSLNTKKAEFERPKERNWKRHENGDDFMVPTFPHSDIKLCSSRHQHNMDEDKHRPISPKHPTVPNSISAKTTCSSMQMQNTLGTHFKPPNRTILASVQYERNQGKDNLKESSASKHCEQNPESRLLTRGKTDELLQHVNASSNKDHQHNPGTIHDTDALLHREFRSGFSCEETTCSVGSVGESLEGDGKENVPKARRESCHRASLENGPIEAKENSKLHGGKECGSLQMQNVERNDGVSEASMVDSVSGSDISPDDVVGVIGQKHFWTARKLIVKQQRIFTVQVFELHRLIKVQKLIAESPHLLLEYNPCLYNVSPKESLAKKLPPAHVLECPQQIVKQKVDIQKLNQSSGYAVENTVEYAVGKPLVPFDIVNKQTVGQHPSYGAYPRNPPPPVSGSNANPWCFHPPSGNPLLLPIMSPSEGLVYKPYAQPFPSNIGFTAPIYGGNGLISIPPHPGTFTSPANGAQPSYPQGIGVHSIVAPIVQTYFPQMYPPRYGMPIVNPVNTSLVLEGSPSARAVPHRQAKQISTGELYDDMHSRNACDFLNKKSGAILSCTEDGELQGSTASNSCNTTKEVGVSQASEGRDVLPSFPRDPAAGSSNQPHQTRGSSNQQTLVIKVVPHNPKSASESAARIFQYIQKERQQYDPS